MTFAERLASVNRLFLDTAPVIYYVEQHPRYLPLMDQVFQLVDSESLQIVTSPITLAECLIVPLRQRDESIVQSFTELITNGPSTHFHTIGQRVGELAATIRAQHNLSLPDSIQAAVALDAGCDSFLTNDPALSRVGELDTIVLESFVDH